MNADIVVIREGGIYRLLHGHLHLANTLGQRGEAVVEVRGEGPVKVVRTANGYFAGKDGQRLPFIRS